MPSGDEWIGVTEASARLGVKPATLYAYVSRGQLHRRRGPDGRRSLFDPAEVDALAGRGRLRPPGSELRIESGITALGADRPYYRGHDALALAGSVSFEQVAGLLWTGSLEPGPDYTLPRARRRVVGGTWAGAIEGVSAAAVAQTGLPHDVPPLDRLQVITAVLAATDPLRFHLDPEAVAGTGRRLIAGMIDALPAHRNSRDQSIAGRLWPSLTRQRPEDELVAVLDAALVLLADHELAASTLAVRAAASARSDPYAVVSTGLGALGGPKHGGASFAAERMLEELAGSSGVRRVIGEWLRRGERIPGLGHTVYKSGDGRAARLLELLGEVVPEHESLELTQALVAEAEVRRLPAANIDLALATLTRVCGMPPGSGEAIFAVARTAGWLAHALEEYESGSLLRPRAVYTGPPID